MCVVCSLCGGYANTLKWGGDGWREERVEGGGSVHFVCFVFDFKVPAGSGRRGADCYEGREVRASLQCSYVYAQSLGEGWEGGGSVRLCVMCVLCATVRRIGGSGEGWRAAGLGERWSEEGVVVF